MKKVIICGMVLGLLSTVSFAQRGRAAGGTAPTARMPNAAPMSQPMAPVARTPNAAAPNHDGVTPNAVSGSNHSQTVSPNAKSNSGASATQTVSPNAESNANASATQSVNPNATNGNAPAARTVDPNATTVPDRVTVPDATSNGQTRVDPNQ
jgi:hypothetical protein